MMTFPFVRLFLLFFFIANSKNFSCCFDGLILILVAFVCLLLVIAVAVAAVVGILIRNKLRQNKLFVVARTLHFGFIFHFCGSTRIIDFQTSAAASVYCWLRPFPSFGSGLGSAFVTTTMIVIIVVGVVVDIVIIIIFGRLHCHLPSIC